MVRAMVWRRKKRSWLVKEYGEGNRGVGNGLEGKKKLVTEELEEMTEVSNIIANFNITFVPSSA